MTGADAIQQRCEDSGSTPRPTGMIDSDMGAMPMSDG